MLSCRWKVSRRATKSIFDKIDEEEEKRAIEEAEADIKAGRFVSHEEVVKWLGPWGGHPG